MDRAAAARPKEGSPQCRIEAVVSSVEAEPLKIRFIGAILGTSLLRQAQGAFVRSDIGAFISLKLHKQLPYLGGACSVAPCVRGRSRSFRLPPAETAASRLAISFGVKSASMGLKLAAG